MPLLLPFLDAAKSTFQALTWDICLSWKVGLCSRADPHIQEFVRGDNQRIDRFKGHRSLAERELEECQLAHQKLRRQIYGAIPAA